MQDANFMPQPKSSWKYVVILLAMILAAGVAVVSILRDRIVNQPQWQISVSGQSKIEYKPDMASIYLGVKVDKVAMPEQALQQLNTKIANIVAALKTAGVEEDNIQTQNYTLSPQYDYVENNNVLSGYNANQTLIVKVYNITENSQIIEKVIEEASRAGVNQIDGINFDVADSNQLKQEARLKAIADAKSKAGALSDALGVELGEVVGWWENIVQGPESAVYRSDYGAYGMGGIGGGGGSPVVPAGNQEMVVEVNLSYKLK